MSRSFLFRFGLPLLLVMAGGLTVLCPGMAQAETQATPATPPANGQVYLDFKDIALPDLVKTISELTGKNFLYDEKLRGSATIISPQSMTLDEAYQLFLAVLNVKGYTVVRAGKAHKIIPLAQAKDSEIPQVVTWTPAASDALVTRLIPLKYLDASDTADNVLSGLLSKGSRVVAYTPLNRLIITDSAANIAQIVRLLKELDVPGNQQETVVIPLRHASADNLAEILLDLMERNGDPRTARRRPAQAPNLQSDSGTAARIIPYSRTNTLIVRGDSQQLAQVKQMVEKLDTPPGQMHSPVNVYYLEHGDAEAMAKTLTSIVSTMSQPQQGARPENTATSPIAGPVSITADKPTNALVVGASPEDYDTLLGIIRQLDIKRRQVFVEALILELSMDATRRLGTALSGALPIDDKHALFAGTNQRISDTTPAPSLLTPSGLEGLLSASISGIIGGGLFHPVSIVAPDGSTITVPALSALIEASKVDTDINILSAPRLLTSDNEEAEIIVGSNVPIITSRLTDTGSGGESPTLAQSVTVERKDVALTLRLTPQITEGGLVRLNVYQEVTDLASSSVGAVEQVGPTLTKRLVRNTVIAEDGKTVVLGGLIGTNQQTTLNKVPLLGDIPLLGWLFRNEGKTEAKTNLLVFITPSIIKSQEDLNRVSGLAQDSMRRFQEGEVKAFVDEGFSQDLLHNFTPGKGRQ